MKKAFTRVFDPVPYFQKMMTDPIKLTLTVAIVLFIVVVSLSRNIYEQKWDDFILQIDAEAHGMVIDIIVLGILMVWINKVSERIRTIKNCHDEIEAYRNREGDLASVSIFKAVKTLNGNKVSKINLTGTSITNSNYKNVDLRNSKADFLNARDCDFSNSKLKGIQANNAIFDKSEMLNVDLSYSVCNTASFKEANLGKAKFSNSNCVMTDFSYSYLNEADFSDCYLLGAIFNGAHLFNVNFMGAVGLTIDQILKAKVISGCKFDSSLEKEFNLRYVKEPISGESNDLRETILTIQKAVG